MQRKQHLEHRRAAFGWFAADARKVAVKLELRVVPAHRLALEQPCIVVQREFGEKQ